MINTKLVLCAFLLAGSACGMESAKKKLKVDVLFEKWPGAVDSGTMLFALFRAGENDSSFRTDFTEPVVREIIARGVDINKIDTERETVLCKAIALGSEKGLEICKVLYACGARAEYSLKRVLANHESYHAITGTKLLCATMWLEQQRKQLLMAYLLSLRKLNVFPKDIVKLILSKYCIEMIPSYCLPKFYTQEQIEGINAQ